MAQAQAAARKIARSIQPPAGASAIANLETRTDPAAVRAARPAGLKTGSATNFSGQYLFDRFVANDKEEITKMDLVRKMVEQLDTNSFKKVIADFVGVAKGYADNAITAAKAAGGYDEKNPPATVVTANARLKTAQNHQTVLRLAYGAIKFAGEQLTALGYDPVSTGYQTMRVIAKQALDKAMVKWDGTKLESKDTREAKACTRAEAEALAEVMKDHPKKDGESRADYFTRVDKEVTKVIKAKAAEKHAKLVADMVAKIRKEAGALLPELLDALAIVEQGEPAPL